MNKPRLKSEHTPEQWAERLRRGRISCAKWRTKPESKEYMKAYSLQYNARQDIKEHKRKYWQEYAARNVDKLRAKELSRHSGMTVEMLKELISIQNNACAICRRPFNETRKPKADHCHDKLVSRGVLCFECNIAEGLIKSIGLCANEFGKRLADYLENPPVKRLKP